MEYVAVAAAVAGGISKIQQGRQAEDMYFAQAVQARQQARGENIKYQQQANAILRRSVEAQAAARARAAAGGINPFEGSPLARVRYFDGQRPAGQPAGRGTGAAVLHRRPSRQKPWIA